MHLTKGQEVCERRRVPQRSHPFCAASIACALCQVAAKSEQVGRVGVHACILVHMHMPFSLVPVTCTPKAPPSTHVRAPRFGVRVCLCVYLCVRACFSACVCVAVHN